MNVRHIPLSLEDLWETSTESFEHTENFLGNFKVRTLAQVSQNKFLPLTDLLDLGRFSKNPMRRRFYRAISFLCVVWSWINMRYLPLRLENLWEASTDSFESIENFLGNFKVHILANWVKRNFSLWLSSLILVDFLKILWDVVFTAPFFIYASYDHESTCATLPWV